MIQPFHKICCGFEFLIHKSEYSMAIIPLPVVILPLIYSGSLFMSDMAARGSPQLATEKQHYHLSQ